MIVGLAPGADFSYIFSGENSAENFPQKMSGKIKIVLGKSFEKSFPKQIPRNFPRKITFLGKNVRKSAPGMKWKFLSVAAIIKSVYDPECLQSPALVKAPESGLPDGFFANQKSRFG
jgi:hypothetical protein